MSIYLAVKFFSLHVSALHNAFLYRKKPLGQLLRLSSTIGKRKGMNIVSNLASKMNQQRSITDAFRLVTSILRVKFP